MMPTIVRSVWIVGSGSANRAAEPLTVTTHLPSGAPTGSAATLRLPDWSASTLKETCFNPGTRRVATRSERTCMISMSLSRPLVDDPDDGQVGRVGLATGRFPSRRGTDADHPVARNAADRVNGNLRCAARLVGHDQERAVAQLADPVGRDQGLFDPHDLHA